MPWPELMTPLPVAPAYGEPATTSAQRPVLTDLFASLLETCLDAAPAQQPGAPLLHDELPQPPATVDSLAPIEMVEAEQEEAEAPADMWGGAIAPMPPPRVEIPLREAPENSTALPLPVAPSTPIIGEPERALAQAAVLRAPGDVFPTEPPRAARPIGDLAFAARLSDRSSEQGQRQLLAVLAAPESEARLAEISFGAKPDAPQGAQFPAQARTDATDRNDRAWQPAKVERAAVQLPATAVAGSNGTVSGIDRTGTTNRPAQPTEHLPPAGRGATPDREIGITTRPTGRTEHLPPVGQAVAPVRQPSQGPQSSTPEREGRNPRQPEAAPPATPDAAEEPARKVEAPTVVLPVKARPAATDEREKPLESSAPSRALPRSALPPGPQVVFAEHRATPMAPYRAPEFVATQPGVRMPWSTPADPPVNPTDSRPKPVHEFSLVVPSRAGETREHGQVQVRVVERAGEIKVAVHTPNTELAQSMREQLGDLVQRLERTGYHTETWQPGEAHPAGLRHSDLGSEKDTTSGRQGDPQGSPQHQSRQHRQQQQDRPRWFETLEAAGLGDVSFRPDRRSTHDLSQ